MAASDGRQLLLQDGFPFPWPEDLLVQRVDVFGLKGSAAGIVLRRSLHSCIFHPCGPVDLRA